MDWAADNLGPESPSQTSVTLSPQRSGECDSVTPSRPPESGTGKQSSQETSICTSSVFRLKSGRIPSQRAPPLSSRRRVPHQEVPTAQPPFDLRTSSPHTQGLQRLAVGRLLHVLVEPQCTKELHLGDPTVRGTPWGRTGPPTGDQGRTIDGILVVADPVRAKQTTGFRATQIVETRPCFYDVDRCKPVFSGAQANCYVCLVCLTNWGDLFAQ